MSGFDELAERLDAIVAELDELAFDRLREAAARGVAERPKEDKTSTAWARAGAKKGPRPPYERPPTLALRLRGGRGGATGVVNQHGAQRFAHLANGAQFLRAGLRPRERDAETAPLDHPEFYSCELVVPAGALATNASDGAGAAFGLHHNAMAQEGVIGADMNPGMHQGFSGWQGH